MFDLSIRDESVRVAKEVMPWHGLTIVLVCDCCRPSCGTRITYLNTYHPYLPGFEFEISAFQSMPQFRAILAGSP